MSVTKFENIVNENVFLAHCYIYECSNTRCFFGRVIIDDLSLGYEKFMCQTACVPRCTSADNYFYDIP